MTVLGPRLSAFKIDKGSNTQNLKCKRPRVNPRLCNSLSPTGQTRTNFKQTTVTKPGGKARNTELRSRQNGTPRPDCLLLRAAQDGLGWAGVWAAVHATLRFPLQVKIRKSFPTPVPPNQKLRPSSSFFMCLFSLRTQVWIPIIDELKKDSC